VPAPEIVDAVQKRFGATSAPLGVEIPAASLQEAMRALRDAYGYRFYILGTATEREASYEILHGVRNLDSGDTLFVRVTVPKEAAEVDSIALVYAGAEWHEREIYDLFGVSFRGHPDLRRILLPDDYPGHPLRKSFAMDTPWGYRPATSANPEGAS